MTDPKKIAFYIRVSRTKQEFSMQSHALGEYCRRKEWAAPARKLIFAEKFSGKSENRTQLDLLAKAAREGLVDTILCYQINRIGRSFLHLVNLLAEFERIGVRVIGINDDYDSADKGAYMEKRKRDMMNDAQFERDRIAERTLAGLAAAKRSGRLGGKPRENDAKIARAFKMHEANKTKNPADRMSQRKIAALVGLNHTYLSYLFRGKRPKK